MATEIIKNQRPEERESEKKQVELAALEVELSILFPSPAHLLRRADLMSFEVTS